MNVQIKSIEFNSKRDEITIITNSGNIYVLDLENYLNSTDNILEAIKSDIEQRLTDKAMDWTEV